MAARVNTYSTAEFPNPPVGCPTAAARVVHELPLMTELRIIDEAAPGSDQRISEATLIDQKLSEVGARFERVSLPDVDLDGDAGQDEVIERYRESLDRLMHRYCFATVDVVALSCRHPRADERRREFARVHRHRVAEGRLVVDGRVVFCLEKHGRVLALDCQRGDFIGLPAETGHWLITGSPPAFRSVRLFTATAECPGLPVSASRAPTAVRAAATVGVALSR